MECNTETTTPDYLVVSGKAPGYQATINYAEIRCFIHILRESDGSGGLGADVIADMFAMAYDDFYGLDVMLQLVGQDELFDSDYYANPDSFAISIFSENPHTDAIDIYLGPNTGAADMALDQIEFPNGVVMGSETINFLEDASPYVDYSINMTVDGNYKHLFKWTHRPCDQAMSVLFTVHSRSQNEEFTEDSRLRVVNCPQSP